MVGVGSDDVVPNHSLCPHCTRGRPGLSLEEDSLSVGVMGGAKAHYDGIKVFFETDHTEDLKAIGYRHRCCTVRMTRSCRSTTAPGYLRRC
jgi:hypothetical protein